MNRCRISVLLAVLSCVSLVSGCQHAVDDGNDGGAAGVQTTENQIHAVVRVRADAADEYIHFGYHRNQGWGLFRRSSPLPTSVLDPAFKPDVRQNNEPATSTGPHTAVQGQSTGPFGGIFGDDDGPRFDASAVAGLSFTAATRSAEEFSATAPGAGNDLPPPLPVSQGPDFNASAAGVDGGACSLRAICDFVKAACEHRPRTISGQSVLTSCDNTDRCYAVIDELTTQIQSQLSNKTFCRAADILSCAANHVRSAQVEPPRSLEPFSYLVSGSFDHCFQRHGVDLEGQLAR